MDDFASIGAVTVTLLLVGVFFVILLNLNAVATSIEKDVSIKVLIDTTADENQQKVLGQQLKDMPEIGSVEYSSKDNELDRLIESFGEDGEMLKLYEQDNPLNDTFIVKANDPQQTVAIAKKIEKMENVYEVNYGQAETENCLNLLKRVGMLVLFLLQDYYLQPFS